MQKHKSIAEVMHSSAVILLYNHTVLNVSLTLHSNSPSWLQAKRWYHKQAEPKANELRVTPVSTVTEDAAARCLLCQQ